MNYTMEDFLKEIENDKITDHNPVDPKFWSDKPNPSVSKKWVFDVQWSDCPSIVAGEVKKIWRDFDLGNDSYIKKVDVDIELKEEYPRIYHWLKHKGVKEDESVWIHWWW